MAFFGIIIILAFAILLLAELLNEVMEHGSDSLARIVDRIDEWIDRVVER